MKRLIYIASLALLIAVVSCSGRKPKAPERLPDEEIVAYREALIKLYPYVVLEDSAYHITITSYEATKLQIPEKYYDRLKADLDYTNYIVREEYNKRGIPITLSEPRIDTTATINPSLQ